MIMLYIIFGTERKTNNMWTLKANNTMGQFKTKRIGPHGRWRWVVRGFFSHICIPLLPRSLCSGIGFLTNKYVLCCNSSCCLDTCYSQHNKLLQWTREIQSYQKEYILTYKFKQQFVHKKKEGKKHDNTQRKDLSFWTH